MNTEGYQSPVVVTDVGGMTFVISVSSEFREAVREAVRAWDAFNELEELARAVVETAGRDEAMDALDRYLNPEKWEDES